MSIDVRRELVGVNLSSIKLGSKQALYMPNLTADCSLRKSHGAQVAGQLLILLPQPPGYHLVHERGFLGAGETETSLKLPLLSGMPLGTRGCLCP